MPSSHNLHKAIFQNKIKKMDPEIRTYSTDTERVFWGEYSRLREYQHHALLSSVPVLTTQICFTLLLEQLKSKWNALELM